MEFLNFLGLDIGFGDTKAVMVNEDFKVVKSVSFPTLIAQHVPTPITEEEDGVTTFTFGAGQYVVGEDARTEPAYFTLVDMEDLKKYAPLLFQAVCCFLEVEDPLPVCASLPPGWWQHRHEFRKILSSILKEQNLVIVAPQGMGTYLVVKEENLLPCEEGLFLLLDFGYNTVDYLLIEDMKGRFRFPRGDTWSRIGITKLIEFFKEELPEGLGDLSERAVRLMLQNGGGKIYGEFKFLEGEKRRAEERYSEALKQKLKANLGEIWKETDAIILTGGGTHYFSTENFRFHKNVIIPEVPEIANAKGQAILLAQKSKERGKDELQRR
ncbi:MAG: ParM/StbA family protein [Candidatus Desulfofervidaceae bacterium]|nr:ParM/StbA family protein [Candidatus Desulfofervidaceae bacterium]